VQAENARLGRTILATGFAQLYDSACVYRYFCLLGSAPGWLELFFEGALPAAGM
jgi:hypothetical protein